MVFIGTGGRMVFGTRSEGGVYQNFRLRCTTATFVYLSHSAVVIPFESARPLRTREKGGDESDPPQTGGVMRPRIAVLSTIPLSRPHGVALVLIYPCGKAENTGKNPFPLVPHDPGSVLAVKGSLRRLRALDCSGPIRGATLFMRGKGGCGFGPCGRAERNLSAIPAI